MGLTFSSTGKNLLKNSKNRETTSGIIALAGSPNVGKSTLFNAITGLHQHTGNWTGKTVETSVGKINIEGKEYLLADIPGTYSLNAKSAEEEVARDFICFGGGIGVIIVCDALCLERNLSLVLQIAEITSDIVICVNLLDEAKKKNVTVDLEKLSELLGLYVAGCTAKKKKGIDELLSKTAVMIHEKSSKSINTNYGEALENAITKVEYSLSEFDFKNIKKRFAAIKLLCDDKEMISKMSEYCGTDLLKDKSVQKAIKVSLDELSEAGIKKSELHDLISKAIAGKAAEIADMCVDTSESKIIKSEKILDNVITGKFTAFPIMFLLLTVIFGVTLFGANIPSGILSDFLFSFEEPFYKFLLSIGFAKSIANAIVFGIYRVVSWVVSVMLPPMAIFFPMFTLLEDAGFLPRIAYNLDRCFAACKTCGKQALTMCMGFGCNAAGVVGCRIIDSRRERLLAIITNSLVPCNGRFPLLITMISLFLISGGIFHSLFSALTLSAFIVLSVAATLFVSFVLSKTLLKGEPSAFVLELPPYRFPDVKGVLIRSFLDRTLFVLGRAVVTAAPAGLLIWLLSNLSTTGGASFLSVITNYLDPFAAFFGLDGVILTAFILALPANEIVIPIIVMAYMGSGTLSEIGLSELSALLTQNGWTPVTAICVILFSMFHFPCATTILTVKKETGSVKWAVLSAVIPTVLGLTLCFLVSSTGKIFI